ncbi:MAG: DUF3822 family protein [Chitinophagaceae bacterium]|nr:DUF3822 family protein [Chitinophagaceae bacterium]
MPQKIIDYHSISTDNTGAETDQLILQIGISEVACMVKSGLTNLVEEFELYRLDAGDDNWPDTFFQLRISSDILNRNFKETHCYYQSEEAILIPQEKFSISAAEDYLALVFGESHEHDIKYDTIPAGESMVNAYRLKKIIHAVVGKQFVLYHPHHTYSSIVNGLFTKELPEGFFVKIQCYSKHIIVAVMKEKKLLLIQTFLYQAPEDILYHVMNLRQQLSFNDTESHLVLCGMLDTETLLLQQLSGLFNSTTIEKIDPHAAKAFTNKDFPLHYFTPFYNLTL